MRLEGDAEGVREVLSRGSPFTEEWARVHELELPGGRRFVGGRAQLTGHNVEPSQQLLEVVENELLVTIVTVPHACEQITIRGAVQHGHQGLDVGRTRAGQGKRLLLEGGPERSEELLVGRESLGLEHDRVRLVWLVVGLSFGWLGSAFGAESYVHSHKNKKVKRTYVQLGEIR